MTLSDNHHDFIIRFLERVPPAWRQRFADSIIDNLLVLDDPSDEDVAAYVKRWLRKWKYGFNLTGQGR